MIDKWMDGRIDGWMDGNETIFVSHTLVKTL